MIFISDDYKRALCKIKKAELTSDCASEAETVPKKRQIIPPKRLFSSSDEDDINEPPQKLKSIAKLVDKKIKVRGNYLLKSILTWWNIFIILENCQISSENNLASPSTSTHNTNKNSDVSNIQLIKENNGEFNFMLILWNNVLCFQKNIEI